MWNLMYIPAQGKNKSPYDMILAFGNPLSGKVLYKLESFSLRESSKEWSGEIKRFSSNKKHYEWLQWTWDGIRIHFYEDFKNNNLVILNAFKKKSNDTKVKIINLTDDNFIYYKTMD